MRPAKTQISDGHDFERRRSRHFAIWLLALIIAVVLGLLVVTDAVGSWAVVVPGALGVIVALWRYRVETERKK
jgi:Flp pilus assembly protein TadB